MAEPIDNLPLITTVMETIELNDTVAQKLQDANANNPDPMKKELADIVASLLNSNSSLLRQLTEIHVMMLDKLENVIGKIEDQK